MKAFANALSLTLQTSQLWTIVKNKVTADALLDMICLAVSFATCGVPMRDIIVSAWVFALLVDYGGQCEGLEAWTSDGTDSPRLLYV